MILHRDIKEMNLMWLFKCVRDVKFKILLEWMQFKLLNGTEFHLPEQIQKCMSILKKNRSFYVKLVNN